MLSKTPIILLFCFLGLAFGLNPTLLKNYFFVSTDNRLSYELFQTRYGIVAHTIDRVNSTVDWISNYIVIDLPSKDAKPILSEVVSACETVPATFQHLHYHAQTNSLVYFCAKNSSLLIIDQSSYRIESEIPFNSNSSLPLARLSTEGMNVVVLSLDTLFTQSTQSSILYKVDMQARKLSTQLLLNSNLTTGEAVVAYAASKKNNYIATNKIENGTFSTVVYSISVIGNAYQLTHLTTFSRPVYTNTITKLFCLGNFVVVSDNADVYFLNAQGDTVKTAKAAIKPLTNDIIPKVYHIGFTSQYDNANIYIHSIGATIDKYSIVAGTIQVKTLDGSYSNLQIAYGNATFSGDLAFVIDRSDRNFKVLDLQSSKTIYTALADYIDFMMTNATYVVVQQIESFRYKANIFDLKTDALIAQVPMHTTGYYFNKEQQMITLVNDTGSSLCRVAHIDIASGKTWTTLQFFAPNPVCGSFIDNARMTEKGNPELILPQIGHYLIISETFGTLKFQSLYLEQSYYHDRINVDFDDLSIYYYFADQSANLVNASFYTLDSEKQGVFKLQATNIISPAPVNQSLFFNINSTLTATLSDKTFRLFDKLESPVFREFANNLNLATTFHDGDDNHYVLLSFTEYTITRGTQPELFTPSGANPSLPGKRADTVAARATGPKSYVLHDYLSQAVGLIRFYDASSSNEASSKTLIEI